LSDLFGELVKKQQVFQPETPFGSSQAGPTGHSNEQDIAELDSAMDQQQTVC